MSRAKLKFSQNPPSPFASFFGNNSGVGNSIAAIEDWAVSYNGNTDCGPETALIKGRVYLILLGDHRKEYEAAAKNGANGCLDYFLAQPESARSQWSNSPSDLGLSS